MGLLNEGDDAFNIILPLRQESGSVWIFAARNFQSEIHAVAVQVIEVLHSARHGVPMGAVCDTLRKIGMAAFPPEKILKTTPNITSDEISILKAESEVIRLKTNKIMIPTIEESL